MVILVKANNAYLKIFEDYIENLIKEGTLKKDTKDLLYVKNFVITQLKFLMSFHFLIEKFSKNFQIKR